jgi:hypothetical protein
MTLFTYRFVYKEKQKEPLCIKGSGIFEVWCGRRDLNPHTRWALTKDYLWAGLSTFLSLASTVLPVTGTVGLPLFESVFVPVSAATVNTSVLGPSLLQFPG